MMISNEQRSFDKANRNGVKKLARVIENPKQLILSKAKELLFSEGYEKLNMRSLSKACDIALGTTYNYFPTKKDLVVEMMIEYWKEYFVHFREIASGEQPLYEKLHGIFLELEHFINNFKASWLTPGLYANPDYVESGVREEDIYMERLVKAIETLLIAHRPDAGFRSSLSTYELAQFIVTNFITMIQMPFFKYFSFEKVLEELLHSK